MKNNLKYKVVLLGLFILLITTIVVIDTYALFETDSEADSDFTIGAWSILLNDVDVVETQTITLNDFNYTNGVHTKSDRFAPGSSGYFDLEIDASGCDVSVEYELDVDDSALNDYPNIFFTITDMDTNQTISTNPITGTILLSAASREKHIRFTLNWTNNSQYDASDTSLIGETLAFEITATFTQYLGV